MFIPYRMAETLQCSTETRTRPVLGRVPDTTGMFVPGSPGTFSAEIFLDRMPLTASNFVDLVNAGFYNGAIYT